MSDVKHSYDAELVAAVSGQTWMPCSTFLCEQRSRKSTGTGAVDRLAVYKILRASSWLRWKAYKQAKGGDVWVLTLTWAAFKELFFLQFSLRVVLALQKKGVRTFVGVLHKSSLDHVMCIQFTDVAQGSDRQGGGGILVLDATKGQKGQQSSDLTLGSQQSRVPSEGYTHPVCTTCGRRHLGECRRAAGICFKCGQAGHLSGTAGRHCASRFIYEFRTYFAQRTSGNLLFRDVEFNLELIPGSEPISKAPYRMAPIELKELKDQLQELLERGLKLEHEEHLRTVLDFTTGELYAKFSKSRILLSKVAFLGSHLFLGRRNYYGSGDRFEAINNGQRPTSLDEVGSRVMIAGIKVEEEIIRDLERLDIELLSQRKDDVVLIRRTEDYFTLREALMMRLIVLHFRFIKRSSLDFDQIEIHVSHLVSGKVSERLGKQLQVYLPTIIVGHASIKCALSRCCMVGNVVLYLLDQVAVARQSLRSSESSEELRDRTSQSVSVQPVVVNHVFLKVSPSVGSQAFWYLWGDWGHETQSNKTTKQYQTRRSKESYQKLVADLYRTLGGIPTGKLFDSCTSKVDSEPPHGSNVDVPNIHACKQTLDVSAGTSINVQKEQSLDLSAVSTEVHQAAETVATSKELVLLFGPLFDEYFNGENQVVLKSSAVTTTDASNKRQQPDSTSSTSTLATTVTANGNFDL
ncbi:hypothetical protein Tco_0085106 [Tanacetum coccineum]